MHGATATRPKWASEHFLRWRGQTRLQDPDPLCSTTGRDKSTTTVLAQAHGARRVRKECPVHWASSLSLRTWTPSARVDGSSGCSERRTSTVAFWCSEAGNCKARSCGRREQCLCTATRMASKRAPCSQWRYSINIVIINFLRILGVRSVACTSMLTSTTSITNT